MEEAVIVAAVRTPIGDFGGAFRDLRANQLAQVAIEEVIRRSGLGKDVFEEVIMGCCIQCTDEANVARMAALNAGLPERVTAFTVNRLCSSGMQAVVSAVQQIQTGDSQVVIAGGVESMSTAPYLLKTARWGQRLRHGEMSDSVWEILTDPRLLYHMGMTAENLAEKYGISREEQDLVAYRSHLNASAAIREGRFKEEIVPVPVPQRKGPPKLVDTDEHPRADISLEALAKLPPVFKEGGTVTAGNSSGINDAAAAMVLMSRRQAESLGVKPLARVVAYARAGVEPEFMGYGPVPATRKVLERAGLTLDDIELIEVNEAFAAQYLVVEKLLELDREKVNVNGSGISLGHPIGSTGARIVITLLYEMRRRNLRLGLATLCVGGGQGLAMIIERM